MPRSPILKSCCCWRSLRKGSYAAGIYTMFYFTTTFTMMSHFMYEERRYLMGNQSSPESSSFLEPETITATTMLFNLTLLLCSLFGVFATFLLFAGIYTDRKCLLVPWIFTLGLDTLLEVSHCIYMFILETLNFNPITAILFTLDFFMVVLHIYAWLCVISQYQEYMVGRGTAAHDRSRRIQQRNILLRNSSIIRGAAAQPSQSSRIPLHEASSAYSSYMCSSSHKHTTLGTSVSIGSKKRVQFPDNAMTTSSPTTATPTVIATGIQDIEHYNYAVKYVKDASGVEIQNFTGTPCSPLKEEDQYSDPEDDDENIA